MRGRGVEVSKTLFYEKGENQRTQYKSNYQYAIIRRKKL